MMETLAIYAYETITQPRAMARRVMAINLPLPVAIDALLLTAVLGALLSTVTWALIGDPTDPNSAQMAEVFNRPLLLAGLQIAVQGAGAWLAWVVGRFFGGTGSLPQAVILIAWVEWVLILVQLAQLVLYLAAPVLAELTSPLALILFFWLMASFIAELHAFSSLWKVILGILLTAITLAIGVVFILAALVGAGGLTNV
jgi:hypothetical protein